MNAPHRAQGQRGAALLLAMIVVTLVATLASGMVWQQWRATQIEAAERARMQSGWMLLGALDWARIILREDKPDRDGLDDTWARPLAEARLSTFLAIDQEHNADGGPEAFLSGRIDDVQARYNLRNLLQQDPKAAAAELAALQRLCSQLAMSSDVPQLIAKGMLAVQAGEVVPPRAVAQLTWFGLTPADAQKLDRHVALLPRVTPVNLNTAGREVLVAVVNGLDPASADRLIRARQTESFQRIDQAQKLLGGLTLDPLRVDTKSSFFEVWGRMRLEQRVLDERAIVERRPGREIVPIYLERVSSHLGGP